MATQDPRTGTAASAPDPQQPFDVFLSHSGPDKDTVERIAVVLKRERVEPWLDAWCLTPGRSWQEEMAAGLAASRSCAVFIGAGDLGAWVREEVELAMDQAVGRTGFRVFPVLLPGVDPLDPGALPPFLRTRMWVDMRAGPQDPLALEQLLAAIRGTPFGPSVPIEPRDDDVPPYRGLLVFEEQDAPFYFGREREVQRLLERLRGTRFAAIVAASGSGKSSLVRAGVVPALRAGRLPGSEVWRIAIVRPGAHPVEALASAAVAVGDSRGVAAVAAEISRGERGLHLAVQYALADRSQDDRAVVVVDQLEEAFTLCDDTRERSDAFDNLVYAASRPGGRCVVIVTMRADFYPRLADHRSLAQLVEDTHELLGPLGDDELRQAIEGPAHRAGLSVEPGLAADIIDDAGRDPGALPLLEHALLETWRRRHAGGLTLAGYKAGGGVQGALADRAETVYGALTEDRQELARRLLLRLTQPGEGVADTRRRAPLAELRAAGGDRAIVQEVIDRFTSERLLTASRDETGTACIEVAHEALIRGWPRLQRWIDDSRMALVVQRRLTDAADEWDRSGRDPNALYSGSRLVAATEATADGVGLTDREHDFLVASGDRERREGRARRVRRVIVGGSIAVGLVLAGMLVRPEVERYFLRQQALGASPQVEIAGGVAHLGGSGERARVDMTLAPFLIDRHEVTNGQYRLCVRADRCAEPVSPSGMPDYLQAGDDMPVLSVTANQAAEFCRFLGRRLPTDAEWERAARGPRATRWPWGNDPPTPRRANLGLPGVKPTLAAVEDRRYASGTSAEGAAQMAGNAAEWTSTPDSCADYRCRAWDGRSRIPALWSRGRGWRSAPAALSGRDALPADPSSPVQDQGFRCVEDRD